MSKMGFSCINCYFEKRTNFQNIFEFFRQFFKIMTLKFLKANCYSFADKLNWPQIFFSLKIRANINHKEKKSYAIFLNK